VGFAQPFNCTVKYTGFEAGVYEKRNRLTKFISCN